MAEETEITRPGGHRRGLVTEATLCHILRGDKILLKKATRGISKGKWNAPGGKIDSGESPEECAKREVLEETGLRVSDLFYHGTLTFMMDGTTRVNIKGHLFSTRKAAGRARSSEEGPVKWVPLDELPWTRCGRTTNSGCPLC
jgi:8-oxo-dGTP diphosphatase